MTLHKTHFFLWFLKQWSSLFVFNLSARFSFMVCCLDESLWMPKIPFPSNTKATSKGCFCGWYVNFLWGEFNASSNSFCSQFSKTDLCNRLRKRFSVVLCSFRGHMLTRSLFIYTFFLYLSIILISRSGFQWALHMYVRLFFLHPLSLCLIYA